MKYNNQHEQYLVAAIGQWNKDYYDEFSKKLPGEWFFVESPAELNNIITEIKPRYIFFPHWRWIVPETIYKSFECICFHMTDLPYGRGGSPLQNLIIRGHKSTKLTALKMEKELDGGPIYAKMTLTLKGNAEQIYMRSSRMMWGIIKEIIMTNPEPVPQLGEVVNFSRRKSGDSLLSLELDYEELYDYIRMLDAPGYPKAYIDINDYRLEFEQAIFENNELSARVKFYKREQKKS